MTLDMSDELKGKISFLGFMEGLASWAREAWRRNPQLAEYFNTDRLADAAWVLEEYDRDEAVREAYRTGKKSIFVFNGTRNESKKLFVNSREELKKELLDAIRGFQPDPDARDVPAMDNFFHEMGKVWKFRPSGLPRCWQEFSDFCVNSDYDGSLGAELGIDGNRSGSGVSAANEDWL